MSYRKRTLRKLTPEARKLAKAISGLESVSRKLKNLVPIVERLEVDLRAELKRQAHFKQSPQSKPDAAHNLKLGDTPNKGILQC